MTTPLQATAAEPAVVLTLPDPDGRFAEVRFVPEIGVDTPAFVLDEGAALWRVDVPRPPVDRLEYRLELTWADGRHELAPDPSNPLRVAGVLGPRSVLELDGYHAPNWLTANAPAGVVSPFLLETRLGPAEGKLWSPAGRDARAPLPLLLVHDGLDYADYGSLTVLLDSLAASGEPPFRAALVAPGERRRDYAADPGYAAALAEDVLPALDRLAPAPRGRGARAGLGASLGALALLHAHRTRGGTFGGLLLQSGSFFRHPDQFPAIERFVARVHETASWPDRIPVELTCGTAERNLGNNRAMHDALAAQGYPVRLREHRDAHNWTSWRDSLEAPLRALARTLWGRGVASR